MARIQSKGRCELCHGSFGKQAMTRHLAKCAVEHEAHGTLLGKQSPKTGKLYHLLVQSPGLKQYWLHLEAAETARLRALDEFLRAIWLECCGHLSHFIIKGTYHPVASMNDDIGGMDYKEGSMDVPLARILYSGMEFSYEYDFGSTTSLTIKVVGERKAQSPKKNLIRLLARNDTPLIPCGKCHERPAQWIDTENSWEPEGWLCEECAGDDLEMCLPVVNSPRTGVCGYTGG